MREQSNGLAGPNIAAGGGEAVSSKEVLGLMRICSVPKASFPVLQERLVLSVDDFFRIPASAALDNETEQPKKNHQRQQPNACIFLKAATATATAGPKSKRRSGSKESAAQTEPEWLLLTSRMRIGEWLENGRPVRGARPSVRAQSRARLPAYSPLTRLLHSCTTWQWLASELCVQSTPLQYRRDSRAEVTAHRAGPAASGDP
jgi:hypothetical protein